MFQTKQISMLALMMALFVFTSMGYASPVTEDTRHSEWNVGITHFPADPAAPANDRDNPSNKAVPKTEDTRHAEWDLGIIQFSGDHSAAKIDMGHVSDQGIPSTEDNSRNDWNRGITRF